MIGFELLMGLVMTVLGTGLIFSNKVLDWYLNAGKGRMWYKMLGESKAKKLHRFFFGPLAALTGIFFLYTRIGMLLS